MYTYLDTIGWEPFFLYCSVFHHSLSLIGLLHYYFYHFYVLRRIFKRRIITKF